MLAKYFESMSLLQNRIDALLMINKEGIVEYSIVYDSKIQGFTSDGYIGRHILDIYPSETEETSNHYRVMKTGQPVLNETETITDVNGKSTTFLNSTFPIEHENEILGTIESSIIVSTGENIDGKAKDGDSLYTLDRIITQDADMMEIKAKVLRVAMGDSPVLIWGETGTGKELIAQSIHSHSNRRTGPFISLNCSALPETILESLLFGTEKGSFTGVESKKGMFEMANNGTLFLDELNSMDAGLQSKLLKAIEDKQIRRLGSESVIHVDLRIISAMSIDPIEAVESDILRKDLFYRLGVVQIMLPPLKDRPKDIALLTDHYIKKYNQLMHKDITGCTDMVREVFAGYSWPGNIRELKNAIEYAFNIVDCATLQLSDLPEHILLNRQKAIKTEKPTVVDLNQSLTQQVEAFERDLIQQALSRNPNITQAAKKLGITRQTLQYKMAKYRL